ncbi:hypothetical protein EPI10_016014 [Gossypium australe]|uniref:Uncharacterized protein n=1 Tax=Gossypium australe TaxID=47621 RepID=A0A5B6VMT6_9ROSI|nr:hypothetical protein EPI10_016014 [Gossypium australe]
MPTVKYHPDPSTRQLSICDDVKLLAELKIKEAQSVGAKLAEKLKLSQQVDNKNFSIDVAIESVVELNKLISCEAHDGSLAMHLGSTKIYCDL